MAKTNLTKLQNVAQYSDISAIVTDLVSFIKNQDTAVTNAYKALVGELGKTTGENPVDHTVVSYIAAKIAEVNGAADTLAGRVEANETAITLLNNNSSTVGSVDYKVAQAINDFATKVSDNQVVDTFKEMVDYVAAHKTEYTNLGALVGSLPEGCQQTTVVAYAKAVADKALQDAKDYADGLASNYDASGTAQGLIDALAGEKSGSNNGVSVTVKTSKGEVSEVSVTAPDFANTYDAKGAASAVQGETENTVKDIEDAINGFSYMSAEQLAAIKALIA